MISVPMEAYLDFSLRRKLDTIVINANSIKTQQSDVNVIYLTNSFKPDNDGHIISKKITTTKTFFLRFVDEAGDINFKMIRSAHFGNVIESDFETFEYYPSINEISEYANYYEGNEVPETGGWLYFAYCPFGENHIELLNGDIVKLCGGEGRLWITSEQRGLKGYKQIPKVPEIFAMGPYKILKLVLHTKWEEYGTQQYSINLFAPDMKEEIDSEYKLLEKDESTLVHIRSDKPGGSNLTLKNLIDGEDVRYNGTIKDGSPIQTIKKHVEIKKSGYIDVSRYAKLLQKDFSLHVNFSITEVGRKGGMIFEGGYGLDAAQNQTHHFTIWVNKDMELCFNGKFNDEYVNTKTRLEKNVYYSLTAVTDNVKITEEDSEKYATFIFLNGRQIWPKEAFLDADEKDLLRRAYEAYKIYRDVCMDLEVNASTTGYIDARNICIKKLLKESGFVRSEILSQAYSLYLKRPKASTVDFGVEFLGFKHYAKMEKAAIMQDSYFDILDQEYYLEGEFYEFILANRAFTKREVGEIALLNALGFHTME